MTVINGIEIDDIFFIENEMKSAVQNNDPIDDVLHVIGVVSNYCQFARRYILAREFVMRLEREPNVILYLVELAYDNQQFQVTNAKNPRHLQLRTNTSGLWHKENMINIGIKKLFSKNWKAGGFCDMDIEFENANWVMDTLKILNGTRDIIQPFSHCIDMDLNRDAMNIFASFGYQYYHKRKYTQLGVNKIWHPGYSLMFTRRAFQKMDGIYQDSILGSGDYNMMMALVGKGIN